jgi:hypothetical protein
MLMTGRIVLFVRCVKSVLVRYFQQWHSRYSTGHAVYRGCYTQYKIPCTAYVKIRLYFVGVVESSTVVAFSSSGPPEHLRTDCWTVRSAETAPFQILPKLLIVANVSFDATQLRQRLYIIYSSNYKQNLFLPF